MPGGATIVATIISIIVSAAMGLTNIYQIGVQHMNSQTKQVFDSMISEVRKLITSKRLQANKILSYLKAGNNQALMSYLYTNPVVSNSIDDINKAAAEISKYETDLSAIEAEMQNIQSELSTKGYSQSISGAYKEQGSSQQYDARLKELGAKYDEVLNKAQNVNPTGTKRTHVYTKDIDARAQNIIGGLNNNA